MYRNISYLVVVPSSDNAGNKFSLAVINHAKRANMETVARPNLLFCHGLRMLRRTAKLQERHEENAHHNDQADTCCRRDAHVSSFDPCAGERGLNRLASQFSGDPE